MAVNMRFYCLTSTYYKTVIMPLTELMNYFNDQLQAHTRARALPRTGFYKVANAYWARFGNLILGSNLRPIAATKEDRLIGYEGELLIRSAAGNLLDIDSVFNSLDSHDQIIHLDRLVRTLHSLNYLQQHDASHNLLSLPVQPRHIVSVVGDHGKTFETILSDCGLGPERVLLHTRLLDSATLDHFNKALSSYRSRGYKVGISLTEPGELALLEQLEVEPDIIFVHYPKLKDVAIERTHNANLSSREALKLFSAKRIVVSNTQEVSWPIDKIFDGLLLIENQELDDISSTEKVHV